MVSTYTEQVRNAFNLTQAEWNALPLECRLERLLDHAVDLLEAHEERQGVIDGPAAAFRIEFHHMSKEVVKNKVRIPDFSWNGYRVERTNPHHSS